MQLNRACGVCGYSPLLREPIEWKISAPRRALKGVRLKLAEHHATPPSHLDQPQWAHLDDDELAERALLVVG